MHFPNIDIHTARFILETEGFAPTKDIIIQAREVHERTVIRVQVRDSLERTDALARAVIEAFLCHGYALAYARNVDGAHLYPSEPSGVEISRVDSGERHPDSFRTIEHAQTWAEKNWPGVPVRFHSAIHLPPSLLKIGPWTPC